LRDKFVVGRTFLSPISQLLLCSPALQVVSNFVGSCIEICKDDEEISQLHESRRRNQGNHWPVRDTQTERKEDKTIVTKKYPFKEEGRKRENLTRRKRESRHTERRKSSYMYLLSSIQLGSSE
jgi:hypothetical protein